MSALRIVLAAALLCANATVWAQPGPMRGGPCAAASGASAPAAGCGGGPGGGMHARWGQRYTPGWSMMTPEERQAHRDKLASLKTYDECKAYMDQHRAEMAERAKTQGRTMPATPRHDACASLKARK